MSDLKLFRIHAGQAVEIEGKSVGLSKSSAEHGSDEWRFGLTVTSRRM